MILKSFKYSAFQWSLDSLVLGKTNLIVGKNSAGKTRSLDALLVVRSILTQRTEIETIDELDTELIFSRNEDEIKIEIGLSHKKVVKEIFSLNGKAIITRNENKAIIDGETVNPPSDKLLMHVRRDTTRYPDIEDIIKWADGTIIRSFIETEPPTHEQLYSIVSNFTPEMKGHILEMSKSVGFPLTMIDTFENAFGIDAKKMDSTNIEKLKFILFKEDGVSPYLYLKEMSNGMQRTILLFIFIESVINAGYPALVAIDDLGEGLDYKRATKVGKLLFEMCEKNNVQLIATSNEEFMMNIVDIDRWNILVRKGQSVRSITSSSKPKIFEEFKYSGLDNFDFFTSDVFNRLTD